MMTKGIRVYFGGFVTGFSRLWKWGLTDSFLGIELSE